ncbi:hypothetical protein PHLGIDRAFT_28970 [Phlebiopsis gigantea 11061_1 CR5-6]|uniref:RNA-dependent RNA polymerase n=1 Tax=Phlebiopsis gigantea (strain 11061_1 CR5-6) TaxID=745531 RepID=A0A0C3NW55_PHLG1|nr:hypothetical protein PHLGIDRAFT_28970 [Phlebiopsis gigantea 11061_1 CR5-6]
MALAQVGQHFLREYGGKRPRKTIRVGAPGRILAFELSRHEPRPELVYRLRQLPYVDPKQAEDRAALLAQLRTRLVSVSTIQCGWQCRDGVFSVEYEKYCSGIGRLGFDDDRRQFRLRIHEEDRNLVIAIRASQISAASLALDSKKGSPTIAFTLAYPPVYESEPPTPVDFDDIFDLFDMTARRTSSGPSRVRLSALDDEHREHTPFSSLAFRIVCEGEYAVENFKWICAHAHISLHTDFLAAEYRDIFSAELCTIYAAWLPILRYEIAFQVDAIARAGTLSIEELFFLRNEIEETIEGNGTVWTAAFIRYFAYQAQDTSWYMIARDGSYYRALQKYFKFCRGMFVLPVSQENREMHKTREDTFECYHARITPTRILLDGPFPERSNRVMRKYAGYTSNFLRVSFSDENGAQYRFDRDVDGRSLIYERLGEPLLHGFEIAGRRFEWLAYSQSGLKQHSVWFMAPFSAHDVKGEVATVNAETIIADLGTFHNIPHDPELMKCPARYGARIAQAFTTTEAAVEVEVEEVFLDEDIKDSTGRRSFTDGVGTMSEELASDIWSALQNKSVRHRRYGRCMPKAIQIRFQGYKGMLSLDYRLQGRAICLRPSMKKFEAPGSMMIEVASVFNKPTRFYLNRPLIMLLEGLQVRGGYDIFKTLQDAVIRDTKEAVESFQGAASLCESYGLGPAFKLSSIFSNLAKFGVQALADTFLRQVLNFGIYHVLRDLKYRARIPVPGGYSLVGVADVHGYLEEGQVFACVSSQEGEEAIYLEGPTMITRSPTIHPGDVQVVHAIGRPPSGSVFDIEPLTNSVVFSTKGSRPLASCLSGGDLDGDVFVCTTMKDLLPTVICKPAEYAVAERRTIDHKSTREDLADFIMEYLYSDNIGIIASTWLITADQSDQGIFDENCMTLARLQSDAADYPKSGRPVPLRDIPRYKIPGMKPDWNAPEIADGPGLFYESRRYIGRLYREVRLAVPRVQQPTFHPLDGVPSVKAILDSLRQSKVVARDPIEIAISSQVPTSIQTEVLASTTYRHAKDMSSAFVDYVQTLRHISASFGVSHQRASKLTEEELVVGTIVAQSSQPRARSEATSQMREQTTLLANRISAMITESHDGKESLNRAWLAYKISRLQPAAFGSRSFRLIAMYEIFSAARAIEVEEKFFPRTLQHTK